VSLLDNSARRKALGRAARERAKLFSWEKEAQFLLAAYDDLWAA
jgi:glycosyltransferase involved in cell wall biosynthesis